MNIGSRYSKERTIFRVGRDYEEMNPHIEGCSFDIQSALIGAPLEQKQDKQDHLDALVSVIGIIILLALAALWAMTR